MKSFWVFYVSTISFILLIIFLISWIIYTPNVVIAYNIISPLPTYLSANHNHQVTTLNVWYPSSPLLSSTISPLDLTAKVAVAYDLTSNQYLYKKNENTPLPMASITKIMTFIVTLEHQKPNNQYKVFKDALVGEDSMGLLEGQIFTKEDLLYGLILRSGNDAAEVLAQESPLGRQGFIQAMNDKAQSLGLMHTHFTNPTGFEGDGDQYTTGADLIALTKYALDTFPLFDHIVSVYEYTIPQTSTHDAYDLTNETNLITSYPGVKGVKTGYTPEAGMCLVTYLEYGGHQIIAVVLHSEDRRGEMKQILDYSLRILGIIPPLHG